MADRQTGAYGRPFRRPRHATPPDIERELEERGLLQAYRDRPPYQQNDYIGWISRAAREETRRKRIDQMLGELKAGDRYMGMPYRSVRRR